MTTGSARTASVAAIDADVRYRHRRALFAPACVTGTDARYSHQRALPAPTRVIPPSRCRHPPRVVNNPLTPSTARARADNVPANSGQRNARTRAMGAPARLWRSQGACPTGPCLRERPSCAATAPASRGTCPGGGARTRAGASAWSGRPWVVRSSRATHTRTPIYATRAAHKGGIKSLCAALYSLIPSLVCDIEEGAKGTGPRGTAAPRPLAARHADRSHRRTGGERGTAPCRRRKAL